jgi:hypothetical protein
VMSDAVYNGMRGPSKIRGGIDVDIAKSAMQKAIRRGDMKLAWTMALRLNEFMIVDEGKGKPVRSNMLNRLPVIAGEDIGLADVDVVEEVEKYVNKIRDSELLCEKELIECVTMMCLAEKSRLGSHLNAVFYQALSTPEYFEQLEKMKPGLLDVMKNIESRVESYPMVHVKEEDKFLIHRIVYLLKNAKTDDEKMATFFYMRILLNSENKYKIARGYPKKRNISSEPIFIVWNEMLNMVSSGRKNILELCYKMFLSENERHIYLTLGLLVFFFMRENISNEIDINEIIEEHGGIEKILESAMNDVIEIPEYAIDKHTKKGRSKGKDSITFAVEGAIVENESDWLKKWKELEEIYIDFRKFCPKFIPRFSVSEIIDSWSGNFKEKPKSSEKKKGGRKSSKNSSHRPKSTPDSLFQCSSLNEEDFKESKEEAEDESEKKVVHKKSSSTKNSKEEVEEKKKVVRKKPSSRSTDTNLSWEGIVSGEMTKEEREKIMSEDTPRGQVLTSKYKKYVYMHRDSGYVYKGPWVMDNSTVKEREKLRKLKFRFDVCDLFDAGVLRGDILMDDEKNLWIRYRLLSNVTSSEWITKTVLDKILGKELKVVDRDSLKICPMTRYCSTNIYDYLFEKENRYCSFLLLYVLGVGDTGLYNVLNSDLGKFIIDIDDDTTKTEFMNLWDVFGRKPSSEVVALIETGVKKEKEKIREYLENLDEKIEEVISIAQKNVLKMDIDALKKRIENVKSVVLK